MGSWASPLLVRDCLNMTFLDSALATAHHGQGKSESIRMVASYCMLLQGKSCQESEGTLGPAGKGPAQML